MSKLFDIFEFPYICSICVDDSKKINYCQPYQVQIDFDSRKNLVEWMTELGDIYELDLSTLILATFLMDYYFFKNIVPIGNYQLVAATSLLTASKYQSTYYPALSEFVYLCDGLYDKFDFIEMEVEILKCVHYSLSTVHFPTVAVSMISKYGPPEEYLSGFLEFSKKVLVTKGLTLMQPYTIAMALLEIMENGFSVSNDDPLKQIKTNIIKSIKS